MSEQTIERCPFCGGECYECAPTVVCMECMYRTKMYHTAQEAISAHNQLCRNNAAAGDLAYWLQAFVDYYSQAGIGDAAEGGGGQFDEDERFNVRHARASLAKTRKELTDES